MKTRFLTLTLTLGFAALCSLQAQTYVPGYTKSNGTYVDGHYRSDSNSTDRDNWSSRGNRNPYTGEAGTRAPRDGSGYGSGGYGSSNGKRYGY